jgi:tRNA pseudouridine38-40 synthase
LRTLRIDLTFDGTDFEGWQRQPEARTVQRELEDALAGILQRPHTVIGCGRTDAGVHANQLVASTRTEHAMPVSELARALDAVLPDDIGILGVAEAPASFHAQRDALWKWYRYTILTSAAKRPIERRTTYRMARVPGLERLQAGAAALEGRHDFTSFANVGSVTGDMHRTLHALRWSEADDHLRLDAVGDGFLYKMVRTLAGTLLACAELDRPEEAVREILAARDRRAAGRALPGRGLCLMAVAIRGEAPPAHVPLFLRPPVHFGELGHSDELGTLKS